MNFLHPAALAFAALVPLIIILYMLRKKRRTVTVPSVLLWQELAERAPQHRALGRIRGLLSLLLNLLVFLLVLLALMRPDFAGLFVARNTVIVLDTRARMQATGVGGSAFERGKKLADQLVQRAGERNAFAVLGGRRETLAPFSTDERFLREAIAASAPSDAGGGIEKSVTLAQSLLRTRKGTGRVIVITDRDAKFAGGEGITVETAAVGEPADNAGITEFGMRSAPAAPQSQEIFIRAANFSAAPVEREIEIRLDGRLLDVLRAPIAAGQSFETVCTLATDALRSGHGWLTATLAGSDALAVDDTARAVAPTAPKPRVLLITKGNWFLEKALAADSSIAFELLGPESWRAGMEKSFDAVVLDDWLPPDAGPAMLAGGNFLFIGRSPLGGVSSDLANPVVTDADARSPLLRGIDIAPSRITRGYRLDASAVPGRVEIPARSADDPLILTVRDSGNDSRRSAIIAFRVADSDLPLRVAFPLLVSNCVHWLTGQSERDAARAGDVVSLAANERLATTPGESGAAAGLAAGASAVDRNGFYEIKTGGAGTAWLAVNTTDAAESDLRGAGAAGSAAITQAAFLGFAPWRWLVLAALALSLFEWLAFHRRWTE